MMRFLKTLMLVSALSSASMADTSCDIVLGDKYTSAITELVKGYQALEKAEVEGQSKPVRSFTLKALDKRKTELEKIFGQEKFIQVFEAAKNKLSITDNSNRKRKQKALAEEKQKIGFWSEEIVSNEHLSSALWAKFSPNGELIMSMAFNGPGRVRITNAKTGELVNTLEDYPAEEALDFSADSRYVISARADGEMTVWDAYTGAKIAAPKGLKPDPLQAQKMSPDGEVVLRFQEDRQNQLFLAHLNSGKETVLETKQWLSSIHKSKFSPDGRYLFISYHNFNKEFLKGLWDVATGRLISLIDHPEGMSGATFSDDSELLLVAAGNKVRIWNTAGATFVKEIQYLENNGDSVFSSVQITPDKKTIVLSVYGRLGTKGEIVFIDLKTEKVINRLTPVRSHLINSVHLNRSEDSFVAAAASNNTISIWKLNTPDEAEAD